MGTNYAPFCCKFVFVLLLERERELSDNNQANFIETFTFTSRYLDGLLNIDNPYFGSAVAQW